jgi:hypothetical protein
MVWESKEKQLAAKRCYWELKAALLNLQKARLAVASCMGDKDGDALVQYIAKLEGGTDTAKDFCKAVIGEEDTDLEITRLKIRMKDTGV